MKRFFGWGFWAITVGVLIMAGCTEKETVRQTITGNRPPPDTLVSELKIENYIQKIYINLLGRKASAAEFDVAKSLLEKNNLAAADRKTLVRSVLNHPDYYTRTYDFARSSYLNNVDTANITFQILLFHDFIRQNQSNPQLKDFIFLVENEIKRLEVLKAVPDDFRRQKIGVPELQRRMADNYFYDQINMGTQNFVLSVFENFIGRKPTENERINAEQMTDGISAAVLLKTGSSKADFLRIIFESKDYHEGQVNEMIKRYLFRNPTSTEARRLTQLFMDSGSGLGYSVIQVELLTSDEYAGI